MFANTLAPGARRRGIVLVLILGMLGLLALIGVTFATFAGQSLVNARNFALSEGRSSPESYMDFALGQLINDTNNPLSALRGHSLLRDMYGNDSVFRGSTSADIRGFLGSVTQPNGTTTPLILKGHRAYPATGLTPSLAGRPQGYVQFATNIPTALLSYQYYGLNFTRWILKTQNVVNNNNQLIGVSQTFEVVEDDDTGSDNFSGQNHLLTLSPLDTSTYLYNNPNSPGYPGQSGNQADKVQVALTNPVVVSNCQFVLDGRYMRAFNGPGMSRPLIPYPNPNVPPAFAPLVPFNVAAYANFKANGGLVNPAIDPTVYANFPTAATFGDPDAIGMDEDYDACDLENWFLALQSADGQVMIPSFHRPSILTAADWTSRLNASTTAEQMNAVAGIAKILRPRQIDNSPQFPTDPSTPDSTTGKITYDVDNDGDGVTDSVWLDLGYPVQKDAGGKLFKPLFAFMVIGQNGRLPLNTVGNLQDRDSQYGDVTPLNPLNPTNLYPPAAVATAYGMTQQYAIASTYYDAPTWDHASHVGASVNEINPKYALQNAPANTFSPNVILNGVPTGFAATIGDVNPNNVNNGTRYWSQVDNAGIDIALTQLRNLLAGTIPQDNLTSPTLPNYPAGEKNFVHVNGAAWYIPNGVIDTFDVHSNSNAINPQNVTIYRTGVPPVAGRWGEPEGIPQQLTLANTIFFNLWPGSFNYPYVYTNTVRAGRSFYNATSKGPANSYELTGDALDDDLDSFGPPFGAASSEAAAIYDYDNAGQVAIASKRLRRFLTPTDPSGNGQLVDWMSRPVDTFDHGTGYDPFGRVTYFRYFRPPGVPLEIDYTQMKSNLPNNSQFLIDLYKMPVFSGVDIPNSTNNQYHSYESYRAPAANSTAVTYGLSEMSKIAVAGAMPFDIYAPGSGGGTFPLWASGYEPPTATTYNNNTTTHVNSESGPYLLGINPGLALDPNTNYGSIPTESGPYLDNPNNSGVALVVNGYPLGSLNKDEADEMNLYNPNRYDQQFSPSDLEWLYRKQDVDGSTLNSRLSQLAPVSFTNSADGQTRRRLFSLESWEPNSFVWANDNPMMFNPAAYLNSVSPSTTPQFPFNSRFGSYGNPSFAALNQVTQVNNGNYSSFVVNNNVTALNYSANPHTVEEIPNPLFEGPIIASAAYNTANSNNDITLNPNPDSSGSNYHPHGNVSDTLPVLVSQNGQPAVFSNASGNTFSPYYPNLTNALSSNSLNPAPQAAYPVTTPALAHRDRRINLNMPLPVASDPTEPVRQKWVRETYQLLKATLPPQAVDTPQELAALSQYVVNIVDFRDPDATMTRFVNTDLMVIPATPTSPSSIKFAEIPFPSPTSANPISVSPHWDPSGNTHVFYPFDPMIADEQSNPTAAWVSAMTDPTGNRLRPLYPVQYGMEYNPIAINEVLAYAFNSTNQAAGATPNPPINAPTPRFFIELVNTLTDDTSHVTAVSTMPGPIRNGTSTVGSGDLNMAGWDFLITPDTDAQGRPDPITGNLPALAGLIAGPAYSTKNTGVVVTQTGRIDSTTIASLANGNNPTYSTVPPTATANWGSSLAQIPNNSFGWSLDSNHGLYIPPGVMSYPNGLTGSMYTPNPTGLISYVPALRSGGPLANTNGLGYSTPPPAAGQPVQVIGDGYYVLATAAPTLIPGNMNPARDLKPVLGINPSPAFTPLPPLTSGAPVPLEYPPDFTIPNNFFVDPTSTTLISAAGPSPMPVFSPPGNQFYWLYLRRPANPFNPSHEMVVVDSFRFPYLVNPNSGQTFPSGTAFKDDFSTGTPAGNLEGGTAAAGSAGPPVTAGPPEMFSLQRFQPYRGGHNPSLTPPVGSVGTAAPTTGPAQVAPLPGAAWGYTEQTATSTANTNGAVTTYGPNTEGFLNGSIAGKVYGTIGAVNNPADTNWDFFPFHDRDFNSVAELLLVPGCSPGLFTKQFAEQTFSLTTATKAPQAFSYPINRTLPITGAGAITQAGDFISDVAITEPHPFPYLNDEFYYTAVSVAPSTDTSDAASSGPYPTQLGGWTGTGWYKMLDFFEVPSSANGAIGTADSGENFDWFRQDRRPGLLNLNLITDEEVFFGLIDDQRFNIALAQYGYYLNNLTSAVPPSGTGFYSPTPTANGTVPFSPLLANAATLPQVISQVDFYGNPTHFYGISDPNGAGNAITSLSPGGTSLRNNAYPNGAYFLLNSQIYGNTGGTVNPAIYPNPTTVGRGFSYPDPAFSANQNANFAINYQQNVITGTKAAFADFLKLRHGGTNFLFGHQAPYTQPGTLAFVMDGQLSVNPNTLTTIGATTALNSNNVWPDKPYRSLSYPDINSTIMRPATPVPAISATNANSLGNTGVPLLTFSPPYFYDLDMANTGNTSPIQSQTTAAYHNLNNTLYPANPNVPTPTTSPAPTFILDPGIRFPWLDLTFTNMGNYNPGYTVGLGAPSIPPIPPRRLFQPPDSNTGSNAGQVGDGTLNKAGTYPIPYLADQFSQLIAPSNTTSTGVSTNFVPQPPNTTPYNPSQLPQQQFGGVPIPAGSYTQAGVAKGPMAAPSDFTLTGNRQHPYYRTEMLQKVMNLSTVRTHQFAVWITVGFFEVVHVGTPELGLPDILGGEVGLAAGTNVRYRSFFTIDRTKATGFNPYYPGEFRDCVTYRRRIE